MAFIIWNNFEIYYQIYEIIRFYYLYKTKWILKLHEYSYKLFNDFRLLSILIEYNIINVYLLRFSWKMIEI